MLAERKSVYEQLKENSRELYEYKYKTEKDYKNEFLFLNEVDSIALQQSRRDLSSSYQNFFKSLSKQRDGNLGFPKFHKKGQKDSYRTQNVNNNIKIDLMCRKVKLPTIGWIRYRDKRTDLDGKILNATISKTPTNKYFVSILIEREIDIPEKIDLNNENLNVKGLDMSLDKFYVDENGNSPDYFRFYRKYESRLVYLQRKVSKKQKCSNNRRKAQFRVNKVYEKITNSRKDFIEKLSRKLLDQNDVIVLETLSLKGMSQSLNLGKSVMDLGYSQFVKRLEDKAELTNKVIIKADKWFASSKTCSTCGYINKDLKLNDREWECPNCHTHHLRDENAGKNLKQYGLDLLKTG